MKLSTPPLTRRDNITEVLHGVSISDPYRWLEDQESPETRSWLKAQIAYTQQELAEYTGREEIRDRLAELMKVESTSQPLTRNGSYFFSYRRANEQQHIIYRRRSLNGPNEPIVDPHPMSPDSTTSVSLLDVSHDGSLLAYGIRHGGVDEVEIRFRDTGTLENLPDVLPAGRYYGYELTLDKSGFYYSINTVNGPRVRLHHMGTNLEDDTELFGSELSSDKIVVLDMSKDGAYLLITVYHGSSGNQTELHVADLLSSSPIRAIVDDIGARIYARAAGDILYLYTTWDAPNGRVFKLSANVPPNRPDLWQEIIPEKRDAILTECALVGGRLFLIYLENVTSRVVIADADGKPLNEVQLPAIGAVSGALGRWDSADMFFAFSSFAMPPAILRYDADSEICSVWANSNAPVDSSSIEVRQVWYASKDGTRVPMFLVHKKHLKMDGVRPVYMTGYGGFNASRTPAFSAMAVLWAERGGIYALPGLRGGGEFGEEWHRAGMLEKKQNVFDDFHAAAEWLIESNCTCAAKLGISGRSNGGLLVGAALTQRPDLYGAAICGYPLLDMLRYHKFLVAGFWVPEYGSSDVPEQFKYLLAYSPYHNVQSDQEYPPIMFVTGDSDTRVAPLHARKMAALMQENTGGKSPTLLHYDVKSGHSEGQPIDHTVEDIADEALFLMHNLGV